MKFVIAGNKAQYDQFIRRYGLNPNDHRFVHDAISVRGSVDPTGYFVGTWKERYDIQEILETMWLCMRTPNPTFEKILSEYRSKEREVY
jgi:hypothetical protein